MGSLDYGAFDALTFDCYGTLIDWEAGIVAALRPVLAAPAPSRRRRLLAAYGRQEAAAEAGPTAATARCWPRRCADGRRVGFAPTEEERAAFGASVARLAGLPRHAAALQRSKRRFKLAVDHQLRRRPLRRVERRLGVDFDWIVTAQQARQLQAAGATSSGAFERIGLPREQILHVAQSLYHDHVPAKRLGLTTVWINRRHGRDGPGATPPAEAQPDVAFPGMASFADAATGGA